MKSASNRGVTELADQVKTLVLERLPVIVRRKLKIYAESFRAVSERYLEKIAAYTKLDTVSGDPRSQDDGVAVDRIVHGATVGSLAVIVLSTLVLVYGFASTVIGFGHDGTATVSTTEGAVPAWDAGQGATATTRSVAGAPANGEPLQMPGTEQVAATPAAWSPSTETDSKGPERVNVTTTEQPPQTVNEEEKTTTLKLYDQHASHYASGEYSKLWNAIDPACVFIDEKGKRVTAKELRPLSQQFFSSIRNARVKYKIHNVVMSDDTIVAHVESELRFDLRADVLFIEGWAPHIKTEIALDTWKKKPNGWRIVETRTLRPENLRRSTSPSPTRRTPVEKTVAYPVNACGRTCAETMMHCGVGPVEQTPVKRNCAAEYSACMVGCRS